MTYVAYLDEFGHIGPYISRFDIRHNDSPVFGLAGLVLPAEQVRNFGTWFFQRKSELLAWELQRAQASAGPADEFHPATWEKKGASLYTAVNVTQYIELRNFTNRFLNKINSIGGFVFYVGIRKTLPPERHTPNYLYVRVLLEAIKRINSFCEMDCHPPEHFILALDEHDQRDNLITAAARSMYGKKQPQRRLIEPPFQLESHRYQTMQAADWIAGLVGRLGAIWADPLAYPENAIHRTYFEHRLHQVTRRSGIRT
ncbi:MAG: DUF3800 domain-containing protein [Devosia sp.]